MIGNNGLDDLALKALHKVSNHIHWSVAPRYYSWRPNRDIQQHSPSINPFKVHYVDPAEITEITRREVPFFDDRWYLIGGVKSGNWDKRDSFQFDPTFEQTKWFTELFPSIRYEDSLFHTALVAHFTENIDWFETEYVQAVLERIENGESVWHNCQSRKDVEKRCNYVDQLYTSIKRNGYKTQRELGNDFKSSREQEIMVDIGRDGKLLFVDGRHRLSISKILDVKQIPIIVGVRHAKEKDTDRLSSIR